TSRLLHFDQNATSTLEDLRTVAAPIAVTQKAAVELTGFEYIEVIAAALGEPLPPHLASVAEAVRSSKKFATAMANSDRSERDFAVLRLVIERDLSDPTEIGMVAFSLAPERLREHDEQGKGERCASLAIRAALAKGGSRAEAFFKGVPEADGPASSPTPERPSWKELLALKALTDDAEWASSQATRPCIVDNWFYEDIGLLAAPGGVGKTTLLLFQAVHIVLGRDLFGCKVMRAGPVIYMTAEDDRDTMVARVRHMCSELGLSDED